MPEFLFSSCFFFFVTLLSVNEKVALFLLLFDVHIYIFIFLSFVYMFNEMVLVLICSARPKF